MPNLTRADVERFRADSQQYFDLADTTIGGWTDLLRRVIDSWLVLEARVRELEEAEHELKEKLLKAE